MTIFKNITAKKAFYILLINLGIWVILEIFIGNVFVQDLRKWASPPPAKHDEVTLYGNPYLIFENVPGSHSTTNQDVNFTANVNSLGFRGPKITIPKPQDVRRLITTGDSSVYGFGVDDNEVFSSVAAEKLGGNVEPINAAVPGYSSYQSLNLLRLRGLKTEPDLLVICNLWSDNNFDSFVDKDILELYTGYEESILGTFKRVASKSAIYRFLDWHLRLKDAQSSIIKKRKVGWQVGSSDHIGLRRVSINDYAANLETMTQMALSNDAEVLFVMLANKEDIEQTPGDKAWDPYRTVMEDTANRHGAPLIRIPELFRESGESKERLFMDEMHPTAIGHRIMGLKLADTLNAFDWQNGGSVMREHDGSGTKDYTDPYVKGSATSNPITGTAPANQGSGFQINGELIYSQYSSGSIQIDLLSGGGRNAEVLNLVKLNGPGPFSISIGNPQKVSFRVYIDQNSDGPDASDPLIDFSDTVIHFDQLPNQSMRIDLDKKSIDAQ